MGAQVVILGGGPAGLAAAIAAAQAGFSVLIAEPGSGRRDGLGEPAPQSPQPQQATALRAVPASVANPSTSSRPIDKCCGEGLLPPAIQALSALGLPRELLAAHGYPLAGIRFYTPRQQAAATFAGGAGIGMRRTTLHSLLTERAHTLGVASVTEPARLVGSGVAIGGLQYTPQWIIGADGALSAARKAAGLDSCHVASRRFAIRQHFELGAGVETPQSVEVYWAHSRLLRPASLEAASAAGDPRTAGVPVPARIWSRAQPPAQVALQAYITPVAPGRVGIAILSHARLVSMPAALEHFPALRLLLAGSVPASTTRGAVTTHRTLNRVDQGNFALVGDASGGVDAITGDGLALAFQQAVALGQALAAGTLAPYRRAHARLLRPARLMSHALLAMGSSPGSTASCMFLLSHAPGLFNGLLRSHARTRQSKPAPQEGTPWQAAHT